MHDDAIAALRKLPDIDGVPAAVLAFEHVPVSASIVSAMRRDGEIVDFCIEYSNRAAGAGTDDRTRHYGDPLFEVIPSFAESGLFERFVEVVEQQQPYSQDDVRLTGEYDGVKYDVVLEVVAIPLGGDQVLSVSHDRTAQHANAARLTMAQEQLERRARVEAQLRSVNEGLIDDLVSIQSALDSGDTRTAQHHASRGAARAAEVVVGLRELLRT
ncbi:MAG: hypothetical protein JWM98_1794 [Thermoleophilia bacterium]|nr:hypothetical protein [Thermoleophilia bacterium]